MANINTKAIIISNFKKFFFISIKLYKTNLQIMFFLLYLFRIEVVCMIDNSVTNIDLEKLNIKDLALLLKIIEEITPKASDEVEVI